MFAIPNTSADIIIPILLEHIEQGSTVITDAYKSYQGLSSNFKHIVVKTAKNSYAKDSLYHTNTIESIWSTLKKGIIGIYHNVEIQHLQRYASEFCFRYNNRFDGGEEKFSTIIGRAARKRLKFKTPPSQRFYFWPTPWASPILSCLTSNSPQKKASNGVATIRRFLLVHHYLRTTCPAIFETYTSSKSLKVKQKAPHQNKST